MLNCFSTKTVVFDSFFKVSNYYNGLPYFLSDKNDRLEHC